MWKKQNTRFFVDEKFLLLGRQKQSVASVKVWRDGPRALWGLTLPFADSSISCFCTATETPARNNSSREGFVLCCSFIMHARNSGPAVTGKPSPGDPTSTSEAPVPTGLAHVRATSGEQTHKWALGDSHALECYTFVRLKCFLPWSCMSCMIMYVMIMYVRFGGNFYLKGKSLGSTKWDNMGWVETGSHWESLLGPQRHGGEGWSLLF